MEYQQLLYVILAIIYLGVGHGCWTLMVIVATRHTPYPITPKLFVLCHLMWWAVMFKVGVDAAAAIVRAALRDRDY
jgi:hypothetical protein